MAGEENDNKTVRCDWDGSFCSQLPLYKLPTDPDNRNGGVKCRYLNRDIDDKWVPRVCFLKCLTTVEGPPDEI